MNMDLDQLQLLVEDIRLIAEEEGVTLHTAAGILWCRVYPSTIEHYARFLQVIQAQARYRVTAHCEAKGDA